jgi:hypothetical protein
LKCETTSGANRIEAAGASAIANEALSGLSAQVGTSLHQGEPSINTMVLEQEQIAQSEPEEPFIEKQPSPSSVSATISSPTDTSPAAE